MWFLSCGRGFSISKRMNRAVISTIMVASVGATGVCESVAQGEAIIPDKELMITNLSVVEDASRISNSCDPSTGLALPVWSFGRLMKDMSGTNDPSDFVLQWLRTWKKSQTINGDVIRARATIEKAVIAPWLARSGGKKLDLRKAPFRLLAITFRPDLRDRTKGKGGEGRFIFGVLDKDCKTMQFTVIFEFALPAASCGETLQWASQFHALKNIPFGPSYNGALEAITTTFTTQQPASGRPNGSFLSQLRTNEIALGSKWQLREFSLVAAGNKQKAALQPVTVKQTPKMSLNNSVALRDLINKNQKAILNETFVIPAPLLAGASDVTGAPWRARGVVNNNARHKFALNTCSGCHRTETVVDFVHIGSREAGQEAELSSYLLGETVNDPVSNTERSFSEIERRVSDYSVLLNTNCEGFSGASMVSGTPKNDGTQQFYCEADQPNNPNGSYPRLAAGERASFILGTASVNNPPTVTLSGLEQGCVKAGGPLH